MSGTKGVFFTLDGILAATLLIAAVIIIPQFVVSTTPTAKTTFEAQDSINVLAELKVSEVNSAYIQSLIASEVISNPDQSVLEQIGAFWAVDDIANAQILSREVLGSLLGDYELVVDGESIYGSIGGTQVIVFKRMVSGITKGREQEGFSARAIATKVKKNHTEIFRIHPQGSGNDGGQGVKILTHVDVPSNNISNATLHISIHYGNSNINSMGFKVNGNDLGIDQSDWLYDAESNVTDNTNVAYTVVDVTDSMSISNPSENYIEFELVSQNSGHAHIHPGSRVEVTYESTEEAEAETSVTERLYFSDILSRETGKKRSGVWAVMPINIPSGASVTDATLHLHGKDIEGYSMQQVLSRGKGNCSGLNSTNAYNIRAYMNDNLVFNSSSSNWPNGEFEQDYDLTALVQPNTNVVSLYMNMYQDCFWGKGDTQLYADVFLDPDGSSYVEYSYDRPPSSSGEFGTIEITASERFNTPPGNDVTFDKTLIAPKRAFIELATLDSQDVTNWANGNLVFQTPRPYVTPGAIFIDNSYMQSGTNIFRSLDCIGCTILPESSLTFTTLVPNSVPYGEPFDLEQDAIDDAEDRLEDLLDGMNIEVLEINDETISLSNVPSLWGPVLVEVRTWR